MSEVRNGVHLLAVACRLFSMPRRQSQKRMAVAGNLSYSDNSILPKDDVLHKQFVL